ncbi:MAG TPA: hypothetical protein DCL44_07365 [Elusimicrobia bacterium]|nr:hypothetical protein [Elusimicrobiota bacterium]
MICLTQNCTLFWYMPANSVQFLNAITAFVAYFHDETLNKNDFFSAPELREFDKHYDTNNYE